MSRTIAIEVGIDISPACLVQRTQCEHAAGSVHHTFFYFFISYIFIFITYY